MSVSIQATKPAMNMVSTPPTIRMFRKAGEWLNEEDRRKIM